MFEVAWQEFNKSGRLVVKRKSFKARWQMERYISKLFEKDSFYNLLATREGE